MSFDTFQPMTREGLAIVSLFRVVLVLSALVLLVVLVPLVYALARFRGRPGEPRVDAARGLIRRLMEGLNPRVPPAHPKATASSPNRLCEHWRP